MIRVTGKDGAMVVNGWVEIVDGMIKKTSPCFAFTLGWKRKRFIEYLKGRNLTIVEE